MIIKDVKLDKKEFIFYLSIAYIFGVFVRVLLFNNIIGVDEYWFEGRPIPIWSDDSGLYGYYAKEILKGANFAFSGDYILSYIIAYIVKITHLHIDWVMFVLPAFLSSLVITPIIALGYILNRVQFSFFVAIIGVIGINYYTRSYLGYIDTDGINMFLIYSLVTSIIAVIYKENLKYSIISILSIITLFEFYHSSKPLIAGVLVGYLILGSIFYLRKKIIYQLFIIVSLSFILVVKFGFLISLIVSGLAIFLLLQDSYINYKFYILAIVISILSILLFTDISSFYSRALEYANIDSLVTIGEFKIRNVLSTVSEVQQRGIFAIYDNFIGVKYYVIVATIGYFLLVYRHREFIFLLPLLILGYMSFKIGIRFTMYSSFVLSFGFVYILYFFKENIVYIGVTLAIFLMFFNILRINSYIKPKYFLNQELKILNELKLKKDSMIISWWDYGWPLWYYTGYKNTYIDNGLNTQGGTVFVSKILFSLPKEAYDLSKIVSTDTRDLSILKSQESINKKVNSIKKRKDIYILLHKNMINMILTLLEFSNRDILTGDIQEKSRFLPSSLQSRDKNYIKTDKFKIDIKKGIIIDSYNNSVILSRIVDVEDRNIQNYHNKSKVLIVISNKKVFFMDITIFNSFLIQSLILNRVDSKYFEGVSDSSYMKILKLH